MKYKKYDCLTDYSESLLKRYYRGETTLGEEKQLKQSYKEGILPDDPVLCFGQESRKCPEKVLTAFRSEIRHKRDLQLRHMRIIAGSIAAAFILFFCFQGLHRLTSASAYRLSDHQKRECLEEALRTIGQVLQEKPAQPEKVIYEDQQIIIAIE